MEDQLPTIFEKSTQEHLDSAENPNDLNLRKYKTHIKKNSEIVDMQSFRSNTAKRDGIDAKDLKIVTQGTSSNLHALRMKYKHKRM